MNRTRFYDGFFNEVTATGDPIYPLTPWTSDIDAAEFILLNVNQIQCNGGFSGGPVTSYGLDEIDSSSGNSIFHLSADSNFGINNGEAFGSGGENINLVSQNGVVIAGNSSITGVSGTLPHADGSGSALDLTSSISHARIWSGYVSGPRGAVDVVPEFDSNPDVGLRVAIYDGLFEGGTDVGTCYMQCSSAASGYGVLEAPAGLGMILSTGNGTTPVILAVNRIEGARLNYNGGVAHLEFLVGATSTDGTGALIQSAGDISASSGYWAGGSKGFTGTLADAITGGANVVGGIIVP